MAPVHSKPRARAAPQKGAEFDALLIATQKIVPAIDALLAVLEESAGHCRWAMAEVGSVLGSAFHTSANVIRTCCAGALTRLCASPWPSKETPLLGSLPIMFVMQILVMLYNAFVFAYMPAAGLAWNSPTSLVFHAIFFMVLTSFVQAINTDAGGVPDDERWRCESTPPPELSESKKQTGEARWCRKTGVYKPDRAHHCRVEGRVVLRMDHHCPWIRNTVGFANHKFFFLFLLYSNIACGMLNVSLLELLIHATLPALTKFLIIGSTGLASLLSGLLGPFFLFHCWLLKNNMTTVEYCEQSRAQEAGNTPIPSRRSPYDLGLYRNVCSVMGNNPLTWLVPLGGPEGDGITFRRTNEAPTADRTPVPEPTDFDTEAAMEEEQSGIELAFLTKADEPNNGPSLEAPIVEEEEAGHDSTDDRTFMDGLSEYDDVVEKEDVDAAHGSASSSSATPSTSGLAQRAVSELTELTDDFKVGCEFLGQYTHESCTHLRDAARSSLSEVASIFPDVVCRFKSICSGKKKKVPKASSRRSHRRTSADDKPKHESIAVTLPLLQDAESGRDHDASTATGGLSVFTDTTE